MKRKDLLLLTILLAQVAPVWAMQEDFGRDSSRDVRPRQRYQFFPARETTDIVRLTNRLPQIELRIREAQGEEYIETVDLQDVQRLGFDIQLNSGVTISTLNPLIRFADDLGIALEKVRCIFEYNGPQSCEIIRPMSYPLQGEWTYEEDRVVGQTLAFLNLKILMEGEVLHDLKQEPSRQITLPHTEIKVTPEILGEYTYDGDQCVYQKHFVTKFLQEPIKGTTYSRRVEQLYPELPSHEDNTIIYAQPFVLGQQSLLNKMAYQGGYEFQSDLGEDKKMLESEEGRFVYSDGTHIYWPKITQELWRKDDNFVSFFIASRRKNELSDRLSFLDSDVHFPEGLYHLQSVKDEEYRHTEKWKRLGEENAEPIFISSSNGVGSIPGIGTFAPHENPNNEDDLQAIKLQNHIQEIMERTRDIRNGPHKGSNKIIVLGPSRHGKSNLIHALAGQHLRAMDDNNEGYFIDPVRIFPGFAISHTREVGTTFPCSWYDDQQNVVYWDCPGFGDPRGPIADITNLFAIRQLFENSPGAKIVLVVQHSAMAIGNSEFKDLLNQIAALFPDESLLHESLSFLVTKKERGNPHITLRNIHENLQNGSNIGFTPSAQNLLAYLVDHPARISTFAYPHQGGEYIPNTTDMWRAIDDSHFIRNQGFNLHLQSDAENLIERASKKLNQNLIDYMKTEGAQKIVNYCIQLIGDYCGPVSGLRQQFKTLLENIRSLRNISSEKPMGFFNNLNRFFDGSKIKKIIEQIGWLHSIKPDVVYNVEAWSAALINHTEKKLATLIAAPQIEFSNGIMSLKGALVGTSDLTDALVEQSTPKAINVWGLNSLFFDEDFLSPSTSCRFISPQIKVVEKRIINLKGTKGTDGPNGIEAGAHGEPGGPGGNGGNVYTKAYLYENLSELTLNLSGGDGGRGGNGVKGADGKNGIDGNSTTSPQTQGSFFGLLVRTYNVQGTDGTDGENGGKAGQGGKAGLSGFFHVDKNDGGDTHCFTQHAMSGVNGTPGEGGRGGAHGKHFHGTCLNRSHGNIPTHHHQLHQLSILHQGPTILPEHQERIPTHANNGMIPTDCNAVNQQEPAAQENVTNGQFTPDYINGLRTSYKAYYNEEAKNPNVSPFVRIFPNL